MLFMNEWDIEDALNRYAGGTPNLQRAARTLSNLKDWTNQNSDGWPYWSKPVKAAAKLMDLINTGSNSFYRGDVTDATDAELRAALTPIKSFLTRHGVNFTDIVV